MGQGPADGSATASWYNRHDRSFTLLPNFGISLRTNSHPVGRMRYAGR